MCEELPLPIGPTKAQLVAINPVTCNPPGGALWDPVNKMLLPATNGNLILTWSFTNDTVVTVLAVQALPVNTYDLGQELLPPACASTNLDPDPIYGVFWHKYKRRMYVTAPGQTTIIWKRPNGPSFTFPQQVIGQWPTNQSRFQLHVANTPAVDLTGGGAYGYSTLLSQMNRPLQYRTIAFKPPRPEEA